MGTASIGSPVTGYSIAGAQFVYSIRLFVLESCDVNRRAVKPRPTRATRVAHVTADALTSAALRGDETDPAITL